jgi:hypothetical protein
MFLQRYHSYTIADMLHHHPKSIYNYSEYISKYTETTIGDDTYRLDYISEYYADDREHQIFMGDKTRCIKITIHDDNRDIARLKSFNRLTIQDIDYNSKSNMDNIKFMNTVLHYLKNVLNVNRVEIEDEAILYSEHEFIAISTIYLLNYQSDYYNKNWGFKSVDKPITIKLNLQEISYNGETAKKFMGKIGGYESLADFVRRYKVNIEDIDIYIRLLRDNCVERYNELLYLDL